MRQLERPASVPESFHATEPTCCHRHQPDLGVSRDIVGKFVGRVTGVQHVVVDRSTSHRRHLAAGCHPILGLAVRGQSSNLVAHLEHAHRHSE